MGPVPIVQLKLWNQRQRLRMDGNDVGLSVDRIKVDPGKVRSVKMPMQAANDHPLPVSRMVNNHTRGERIGRSGAIARNDHGNRPSQSQHVPGWSSRLFPAAQAAEVEVQCSPRAQCDNACFLESGILNPWTSQRSQVTTFTGVGGCLPGLCRSSAVISSFPSNLASPAAHLMAELPAA